MSRLLAFTATTLLAAAAVAGVSMTSNSNSSTGAPRFVADSSVATPTTAPSPDNFLWG